MRQLFPFILLGLLFTSCRNTYHLPTVNNNVCKTLKDKVILYAIFVDSEKIHPWSEYDINSTKDSIQKAIRWVEKQALAKGMNLNIQFEYAQHKDGRIPFKKDLRNKTLSGTLFMYPRLATGIKQVDKWADEVAKQAAANLPEVKSGIILTQNKNNSRERLIARLRDLHQTDNVAVMYFTNSYFENELSVTLHTANDNKIEYAVVSQKNSAVIAHEFLHLFGAEDMYRTKFDRFLFQIIRKKKLMKKYNNEIMSAPYRSIDKLYISNITEYLIGWKNSITPSEVRLLYGRRVKSVVY